MKRGQDSIRWYNLHLAVSFITLFVIGSSSKSYSGNPPPVIFVPGNGGSQVDAKLNKTSTVHYFCDKTTSNFFNIWLNMELLVPLVIDCWVDNIKLVYDNTTRTTRNNDGVLTRIPGFEEPKMSEFGDPFYTEWVDPSMASTGAYFKDIANTLATLGYKRNISIRGAPYDFRKAPNENRDYFVKLKVLVEDTYSMNNNTSVVLISHSMGGPMSLYFLQQQTQKWKDTYIKALITLSGAWGGSIKAIKIYAVGDSLGAYFLSETSMREVQITFPSIVWLLPSSWFWKPDEVFIESAERNYTWSDIKQYLYDVKVPWAWDMWLDLKNYSLDFQPPGVEVHCLHGYKVDTVERLLYKKGGFPGYPKFVYGDGDGTVNKRSLEGCTHWSSVQKQPVYHQTFPDMDHMQVLSDSRVIEYIRKLFVTKL